MRPGDFLARLFSFCSSGTATTNSYTLSLHDALPISVQEVPHYARHGRSYLWWIGFTWRWVAPRSEEHTSELQSLTNLVCRLLLEKKRADRTVPRIPSSRVST